MIKIRFGGEYAHPSAVPMGNLVLTGASVGKRGLNKESAVRSGRLHGNAPHKLSIMC